MSDNWSISTFYGATDDYVKAEISSENEKSQIVSHFKTKWRLVILTGVIFFLVGIENAMVAITQWPCMHQIDKDATYSFFGVATAISQWGHVLFTAVFALWNYRFQTVKWPLIIGRIIAIAGSILYICVELFQSNRRYVLMACYILFSIAASSAVVLRVYLVLHSTEEDRPRACSVLALSNVISFVVGPSFSGIDYPGKMIVKGIYFNLFSAPIWVATAFNVVSLCLIIFVLPEMSKETQESRKVTITWKLIKEYWAKVKALQVPWILVSVVLFERIAVALALTTMGNLISPMMITVWGMSNKAVVSWISAGMGIVGTLAIITAAVFMTTRLSKIVPSRVVLLVSLFLGIIMYVVAFPYPFSSQPVAIYNETAGTGCDPTEYNWCEKERGVNVWVFMSVVLIAMGMALPTAQISLDSIYSKIVGEANQSIMQGFVVMVDDIVNISAPLYVAETFSNAGATVLWIINGCITILAAIVWSIAFRWMKPY